MTIDWLHFTPWTSLAGGLLIGLAASGFVLLNGRIAGISGILGGLLRPLRGDIAWRLAFLAGLVGAPLAYALFFALPEAHIDAGDGALAAAGLLVGWVPVTARAAPVAMAYVGCRVCLRARWRRPARSCWRASSLYSCCGTSLLEERKMSIISAFIVGLVFGIGLIVSGMTNPAKVQGFLDLAGDWDPSLALVMGGAILVGLVTFRFAGRRERSLLGEAMRLPTATVIDRRLVLGGLAFGAGWGLAGFCPGPALASLFSSGSKGMIFTGAMLAGMLVFEVLERRVVAARARTT